MFLLLCLISDTARQPHSGFDRFDGSTVAHGGAGCPRRRRVRRDDVARGWLGIQTVLAAAVLTHLAWVGAAQAVHWSWPVLVIGILMVATAETYPLEMPQGRVTLSSAALVGVTLIAGTGPAIVVAVLGSALSYGRRPFRGLRSVASLAVYVVSLQAAAQVTAAMGLARTELLPFLPVFILAFTVVNHLLVDCYFFILNGTRTWRPAIVSLGWEGVGWLASFPLPIFVWELDRLLGTGGVVLAAIPYAASAVSLGLWQEVKAHTGRLEAIAEATNRIARSPDEDGVFGVMAGALQTVLGYELLAVYLYDESRDELVARHVVHAKPDQLKGGLSLPADQVPWATVLKQRRPVLASHARRRFGSVWQDTWGLPPGSVVVAPMATDEAIFGVLLVAHAEGWRYGRPQQFLVATVATQAAVALERNRLIAQVREVASTDPMIPELYNYRYFSAAMERALASASPERPVSLAFLDVDRFKAINDRYGHLRGDAVLREVVQVMRDHVRSEDLLARYAGDEFVLLLRNTSLDEARSVVTRVQRALAATPVDGLPERLTVSAGVACYPLEAADAETLLSLADSRMYLQKSARRDSAQTLSNSVTG
jgi:diguanylate cyclase (GGDEF)-like protein